MYIKPPWTLIDVLQLLDKYVSFKQSFLSGDSYLVTATRTVDVDHLVGEFGNNEIVIKQLIMYYQSYLCFYYRHWIAVFGHILKRDKKQLIDKLRQKFDDRKGSLHVCVERDVV